MPARAARLALAPALLSALLAAHLAAAPAAAKPAVESAEAAPSPALRARIAALALRQVAFGSVSLLPVRFEAARLAGPIEDGGRTLYCVSAQMKGRTFGKPERPKVVLRLESDRLSVIDDDEVCSGHRSQPFPELESLGNAP